MCCHLISATLLQNMLKRVLETFVPILSSTFSLATTQIKYDSVLQIYILSSVPDFSVQIYMIKQKKKFFFN